MMLSAEEIVSIFKERAAIAYPEAARLLPRDNDVLLLDTVWSQRDVTRGEKLSLSKNVFLKADDLSSQFVSPFVVVEKRLWDVYSPSGALRAVLTKREKVTPAAGKKEDAQFFVQIWRQHELVKTIDISAVGHHGDVLENDGHFGCLSWSYFEGHLLYTAEKSRPKTQSYFKVSPPQCIHEEEEGKPRDPEGQGEEYAYEENWGEQMSRVHHPVLCTLDVESETVNVLDNVPAGVAPGQAVWCPDDAGVLFVGWAADPYPLGMVYCMQRESAIYHIDLEKAACRVIGHDDRAARSPRFSPNGELAVWLEQEAGGPHMQCQRLICCEWSSKEIRTIIDIVDKAGDGFPGINTLSLPTRCWCSDNRRIVLTSVWRSRVELLLVDTVSKLGRQLSTGMSIGTGELLDLDPDLNLMVVRVSSPSRPHDLVLARVPSEGQEDNIVWVPVNTGFGVALSNPDGIVWTINRHIPDVSHPEFGASEFETILVGPAEATLNKDGPGLPLIVFPHGGPHSILSAQYSLYVAGFVACGFAVLMINYRGSWGFGQDCVRSLLGRVGQIDVADCYQATKEMLNLDDQFKLDPRRVALFGGSHGGFLVCHLAARYPETFSTACCRNPVVNIASMIGVSDIPDWCYVEAGLGVAPNGQWIEARGRVPRAEDLGAMLQMSPMSYVDGWRVPTLFMVGAKDRRVPNSQALELYHCLKSRGVTVRLYVYPEDAHPIISVPAEGDAFVNVVRWYQNTLPKPAVSQGDE